MGKCRIKFYGIKEKKKSIVGFGRRKYVDFVENKCNLNVESDGFCGATIYGGARWNFIFLWGVVSIVAALTLSKSNGLEESVLTALVVAVGGYFISRMIELYMIVRVKKSSRDRDVNELAENDYFKIELLKEIEVDEMATIYAESFVRELRRETKNGVFFRMHFGDNVKKCS